MDINYSFIIPHKNSPDLLRRCLDSIPVRDDIQIIVVDDNSDIASKPNVSRPGVEIVFLSEEQSKGPGCARNKGMEKAIGKWLLFPDADDFYEKGFIDDLDVFVNSSNHIVFFDFYNGINLETGECRKNIYSKYLKEFISTPPNARNKKLENNLKLSRTEAWHQMFSSAYIRRLGIKFHELASAEDAWFTNYAAVNAEVIDAIEKKLYYWVRNPKSITNSKHDFSFYKQKERELLIVKKLRAKQEAWDVITPFWSGLGGLAKREGYKKALQVLFMRLGNGLIEWRILWHKYIKKA